MNSFGFSIAESIDKYWDQLPSPKDIAPYRQDVVQIGEYFDTYDRFQALQLSIFLLLSFIAFRRVWRSNKKKFLHKFIMFVIRATPFGAKFIQDAKNDAMENINKEIEELFEKGNLPIITDFPEKGLSETQLMNRLENTLGNECGWKKGKVFGYVYSNDEKHKKLMNKVYSLFSHTNPLHGTAFPTIAKMEHDVVQMVIRMMHGSLDGEFSGTMTSGGTESILMACLAYRNYGRQYMSITQPELILPTTAHAAFDKACHYFGIKPVKVPVGPDYRVDVLKVAGNINRNTIAIVGSAPAYPHGVVDDIEALGDLADRYHIGLHVDGCLGGFILPWLKQIGKYNIPEFDFRIKGVTSMSADCHKYGLANKGSSVVVYRKKKLFSCQIFSEENWSGGLYASPTMQGSRPGGLIASAYASLVLMGQEGFRKRSELINLAASKMKKAVISHPELQIVGQPYGPVFAFTTTEKANFNIFTLGEAMSALGWNIERQQKPNSLHCTTTSLHMNKGVAEQFAADLKTAVAETIADPNLRSNDGLAPVYGMASGVPEPAREVVGEILKDYFVALYSKVEKKPRASPSSEVKKSR